MVMAMSKGGFERAADLAQTAKAIADIIKAALKGGWQGAAIAALKAYWPRLLPIAIVVILLPAIIICCLPAMLFGFGGQPEEKATEMQGYYSRYDEYLKEQLDDIIENELGRDTSCDIEYTNDSLDVNWLMAIDCVNNENDLDKLSDEKLKSLIKQTYTYEFVDKEPDTTTETSDPWDDTAHRPPDETEETGATATKVMKVTTLSPNEIMENLNFDDEHKDWATLIYETYVGGQDGGGDSGAVATGDFASPFPDVKWRQYVTSEFGKRTDPVTGEQSVQHNGLDLGRPQGTEIHAVQGGTVKYVINSDVGLGLHLAIDHGGGLVTIYGHCSAITVKEGDIVQKGDVIAKVGSTGKSTGPHLHLQVEQDSVPQNPRRYLS